MEPPESVLRCNLCCCCSFRGSRKARSCNSKSHMLPSSLVDKRPNNDPPKWSLRKDSSTPKKGKIPTPHEIRGIPPLKRNGGPGVLLENPGSAPKNEGPSAHFALGQGVPVPPRFPARPGGPPVLLWPRPGSPRIPEALSSSGSDPKILGNAQTRVANADDSPNKYRLWLSPWLHIQVPVWWPSSKKVTKAETELRE